MPKLSFSPGRFTVGDPAVARRLVVDPGDEESGKDFPPRIA